MHHPNIYREPSKKVSQGFAPPSPLQQLLAVCRTLRAAGPEGLVVAADLQQVAVADLQQPLLVAPNMVAYMQGLFQPLTPRLAQVGWRAVVT